MKGLRLLLLTRRFWPLVGGAEKVMGNLAAELVARGCQTTILTTRWEQSWPCMVKFRSVSVVRLGSAPRGLVGMLGHMRRVGRWLTDNADQFDLVCVSALRHEAYAALRALGRSVPVVLRAETAGRTGDCLWQVEAPCGWRIKRQCLKAAAMVAPSRTIERELQAAGYPRERIHLVPNGVPLPPEPTPTAKATARQALANANPALELPNGTPLVVYTGRLVAGKGLEHLVAAWDAVVARRPNARLWLAGEGPERPALIRQIEALGLAGRIVLVGVFDGVDELLAAADLFVAPTVEGGVSLSLLEAMAAGLPIVAGDTRANREVLIHERHGLLAPPADADALAATILCLLDQPALASRLGMAARERAAAEFALDAMVQGHLTLLRKLTGQ